MDAAAGEGASTAVVTTATEVLELLNRQRPSASEGARAVASARAVLLLMRALTPRDFEDVPAAQARVALHHLEHLRRLAEPGSEADWPTVSMVTDRLTGELATALEGPAQRAVLNRDPGLSPTAVTAVYEAQAARERQAMRALGVLSLLCALTAVALLATGAWVSLSSHTAVAMLAGAAGAAALSSAALGWQSARHRAFSREAQRLAIQFELLDPYLDKVDDGSARDAARIAMLQRMFPRLLEDVDPVREPRWPS